MLWDWIWRRELWKKISQRKNFIVVGLNENGRARKTQKECVADVLQKLKFELPNSNRSSKEKCIKSGDV